MVWERKSRGWKRTEIRRKLYRVRSRGVHCKPKRKRCKFSRFSLSFLASVLRDGDHCLPRLLHWSFASSGLRPTLRILSVPRLRCRRYPAEPEWSAVFTPEGSWFHWLRSLVILKRLFKLSEEFSTTPRQSFSKHACSYKVKPMQSKSQTNRGGPVHVSSPNDFLLHRWLTDAHQQFYHFCLKEFLYLFIRENAYDLSALKSRCIDSLRVSEMFAITTYHTYSNLKVFFLIAKIDGVKISQLFCLKSVTLNGGI